MGRAYAFAEGDTPMPAEVELSNAVQKYGALSIYGRPLTAKEIGHINIAENVVNAYQNRAQSNKDMAEWAENNKESADLLGLAFRQAEKMGLINGS